jgi:hypothetical protein
VEAPPAARPRRGPSRSRRLRPDEERSIFDPDPIIATGELQPPFTLPPERPWWPRLRRGAGALRYYHKGKLIALENKDEMAKRLGRSPDLVDALLMSFTLGDDE